MALLRSPDARGPTLRKTSLAVVVYSLLLSFLLFNEVCGA